MAVAPTCKIVRGRQSPMCSATLGISSGKIVSKISEGDSLETKSIGWIMIARTRLESATRPIAATSLPTIVEFTSYRLLDLRAGESDVPELPLAHPMKLDDRRPLDSAGEV